MKKLAIGFVIGLLLDPYVWTSTQPVGQVGVAPKDAWTCPASHPVKGNLTTRTGECIYHIRGGAFYSRTKPELCFATEEEARQAGCRRSKR